METVLADGVAMREAGGDDLRFIADGVRESVLASVTDAESALSDLWIDATVAVAMDSLSRRAMGDEAFIAVCGGERAGSLWLGRSRDQYTCEETGYILGIHVTEGFRRRGIGKAMIGFAESWCRERGLASLALDVGSCNASADALYRSMGYEPRSSVLRKILHGVRDCRYM